MNYYITGTDYLNKYGPEKFEARFKQHLEDEDILTGTECYELNLLEKNTLAEIKIFDSEHSANYSKVYIKMDDIEFEMEEA